MPYKVVVVSGFFSEGMGYTENCLPKTLASLGHDVHVVTSNFNVYGNTPEYDKTYRDFLGPADQGARTFTTDGYTVHRLQCSLIRGYVSIHGLGTKLRELAPDVVHCTEIASLQTYKLALMRRSLGFRLFAETHQHMSVVKPYLKNPNGQFVRRFGYWLTRTLPTSLASRTVEKCYAIAPDCVEVATRFYGVSPSKIRMQSLGTDTLLFRPAESAEEREERRSMREAAGYGATDIVCVYTGRFSKDKNPLVLAQAIDGLVVSGEKRFHGLFVGEGEQRQAILQCGQSQIRSFARHIDLAKLYRMADIAIWPRQESMSMLDAAACGLPLIVSADIGENERVAGNGCVYRENDAADLGRAIVSLVSAEERASLAAVGRKKMREHFSWTNIAQSIVADYAQAIGSR